MAWLFLNQSFLSLEYKIKIWIWVFILQSSVTCVAHGRMALTQSDHSRCPPTADALPQQLLRCQTLLALPCLAQVSECYSLCLRGRGQGPSSRQYCHKNHRKDYTILSSSQNQSQAPKSKYPCPFWSQDNYSHSTGRAKSKQAERRLWLAF